MRGKRREGKCEGSLIGFLFAFVLFVKKTFMQEKGCWREEVRRPYLELIGQRGGLPGAQSRGWTFLRTQKHLLTTSAEIKNDSQDHFVRIFFVWVLFLHKFKVSWLISRIVGNLSCPRSGGKNVKVWRNLCEMCVKPLQVLCFLPLERSHVISTCRNAERAPESHTHPHTHSCTAMHSLAPAGWDTHWCANTMSGNT